MKYHNLSVSEYNLTVDGLYLSYYYFAIDLNKKSDYKTALTYFQKAYEIASSSEKKDIAAKAIEDQK
jgi:hypothetical protein